jgi:hypothetical protein
MRKSNVGKKLLLSSLQSHLKLDKSMLMTAVLNQQLHICTREIHLFDNYIIWPGSLALMNREPITLRNLLLSFTSLYFIPIYKASGSI